MIGYNEVPIFHSRALWLLVVHKNRWTQPFQNLKRQQIKPVLKDQPLPRTAHFYPSHHWLILHWALLHFLSFLSPTDVDLLRHESETSENHPSLGYGQGNWHIGVDVAHSQSPSECLGAPESKQKIIIKINSHT